MPTAAFATLGCKVNQYETQRILDDFEERGFAITEFNVAADVYVINTCSVTVAAERKSRQMVRKLARQNPDAIVVMTGCYGEMARIKGETVDETTLVVPNHRKLETLQYLLGAYPHFENQISRGDSCAPAPPAARRTRATIKVQDGCNVFCTFCSIPYTRKYMVSRALEEIVAEAEKRAAQGYRELVVTGVLVGAYGEDNFVPILGADLPRADRDSRLDAGSLAVGHTDLSDPARRAVPDCPIDLADCLLRLAKVPGIERVRLSSIEPTQVTERLLDAFASEPRLCRHLHIPLQSGDTGVLRSMNRPYDQGYYLELCHDAKSRLPDLAITSDIMVGFPGEDRQAFENTLAVVREVGYARAHLFRYSPRPNTPAAEFRNQIPEAEKEARSKELAAACRETQQRFIERYIGRTLDVLVEGKEPVTVDVESGLSGNDEHDRFGNSSPASGEKGRLLNGYTSNYIRVEFTGGSHLIGTVAGVRLLETSAAGAIGAVGGAHFGSDEAPPDAEFIPLATLTGHLA